MLDSITENKRSDLLIKIVSQTDKGFADQLYFALESTCHLLGMEIGIISNINDNFYTVEHFSPTGIDLYKGQRFELGNTYCSITLESEGVFSVKHMAESDYNMHPCYGIFHLESYIGIPFEVDGKLYGTINFSSSKPKKGGFTHADHQLINLLGNWTGGIIHRQQIENELNHEKELYKLLSTNSAELVCLHNIDGTFKFVSESSGHILGYLPEELIGKSPFHFIHPNDLRNSAIPQYRKALKGMPVVDTEFRMRKKNGEFIWMNTSAEPVFSESGEIMSLQSTSRNVSDKKRLELLFNESQEMAKVGGWEFDVKSGKLYWTDEVYRIHDKPIGEEVFVEEGLSFFTDESRLKLEQAIQKTIESAEIYDLELDFISAKGTKKRVRAIGRAEIIDGEVQKLHGTFQDISELKEKQDQIFEQNEQLKSEKQTKEKLYSILTHDIRNSLFGIAGYLELTALDIQEENFDKKNIQDKLNLLIKSSKSSIKLLESIQKWIQIQSGYLTKSSEIFNLIDELEQAKNIYQASLVHKNISLKQNFDESEYMPVFGDPEMIGTILRNFINNAIKYSNPDSKIHLTINNSKKDFISISIRDFGIGISEEMLNRLFDFKNRPQRDGTQNEPGTGLGLLLCKDLAAQNNSTIIVKSYVGEGTEMTLQLPANENVEANHSIKLISTYI